MNRYQQVKHIIEHTGSPPYTLLDVGCRDCVLKGSIGTLIQHYCGLDLFNNPDGCVDIVNNIECGLPFKDGSFDFVAALDCLEHLNDLQAGAEELLRVARKAVLISLPNMAYLNHRASFFFRGCFATGKYTLRYNTCASPFDRHRWVTVVPQTDRFMQQFAAANGVMLEILRTFESRKRRCFAAFGKAAGLPPAWWVPGTLYVARKI